MRQAHAIRINLHGAYCALEFLFSRCNKKIWINKKFHKNFFFFIHIEKNQIILQSHEKKAINSSNNLLFDRDIIYSCCPTVDTVLKLMVDTYIPN